MPRLESRNIAMIESLESRRLLSAAHAPLPFTNVVGLYDVSANYANGETQSFTVLISSQHGGTFSGTSDDFVSVAVSKITGTVNRERQIHFNLHPIHFPGQVNGKGTVDATGNIISASVRITLGRQSGTGTFTLEREST